MKKIAIIDIGSNTVRMCVYEMFDGVSYHLDQNIKESVRLRNYVVDNQLSQEGIEKLRRVLNVFTAIIHKDEIKHVKFFATQTIRMVKNQQDVLDLMHSEFGIEIDVFNEEEESLLGFKGMNTYLIHEDKGLYVDLGGGSTEIVYFEDDKPISYYCFNFGSVVLRSMISHAIPTEDEISYLRSFLFSKFEEVPWLRHLNKPLVVVGGSSRNLVRIDRFLTAREEDTHGYRVGLREITRIRKILMLLTIEEIQNIKGFTQSRSDIIIPSILVFEMLFKYIKAEYYVCSRTGLREGVLLDMIGR